VRRGRGRRERGHLSVETSSYLRWGALGPVKARYGSNQLFGVIGLRIEEHLVDLALLHETAALHDGNPIAYLVNNRKVVADEHHRQPVLVFQMCEKIERDGLNRHVECTHWLIGNEDVRTWSQRTGYGDSLTLTS